jgi:hypothetical protein
VVATADYPLVILDLSFLSMLCILRHCGSKRVDDDDTTAAEMFFIRKTDDRRVHYTMEIKLQVSIKYSWMPLGRTWPSVPRYTQAAKSVSTVFSSTRLLLPTSVLINLKSGCITDPNVLTMKEFNTIASLLAGLVNASADRDHKHGLDVWLLRGVFPIPARL